jgi:mono/diheme cytochrome c family protein
MKNPKPRDAKRFSKPDKRLGGALAVLALAIAGVSFHTLIQSAHAQTTATEPMVVQRDTLAGAALIKRGEYLARAGDCVACHTADKGRIHEGHRLGRPRDPCLSEYAWSDSLHAATQ